VRTERAQSMNVPVDREHVVDAGTRRDGAVIEVGELDRPESLERAACGELGLAITATETRIGGADLAPLVVEVEPHHRGPHLVAMAAAIVDEQGLGKQAKARYAARWRGDTGWGLHQ
jgi:hypothetical protein